MTNAKAQCFECLRWITVNKDGRLRWHFDSPFSRWQLPAKPGVDRCAGSGWVVTTDPPAGEVTE